MAHVWQTHLGDEVSFDAAYHQNARVEIASFISEPPGVVLDVGCGGGATGRLIKEKFPGTRVIGIEYNPRAAEHARRHLDDVICASIDTVVLADHVGDVTIGTVLLLDVLEHLYDPWRALLAVRPLLTGDAQVALSLPNVRNLFIQSQLNNEGTWKYDTHGLLDITHIRFFAKRDILRMLRETGFAADEMRCHIDPRFAELYRANHGKADITLQAGRLKLEKLSPDELQEYCTLQFIVLAHPSPAPDELIAA
jgi:O-antigen biosynthesis protein